MKRFFTHFQFSAFSLVAVLVLLMGQQSWGQTTTRFNDGYLTVFKVTSSSALANTATAIVLEEYVSTVSAQSSNTIAVAVLASAELDVTLKTVK